jgi:Histidine kinase-, DNA gyrase B-, and HSP90-like ATPase
MGTITRIQTNETPWSARTGAIVIGKDILELLSSSMYVDPMSIFREYVQNSADAVDSARALGLLDTDEHGLIDITINTAERSITIRDNGTGVPREEFADRLTAFGASTKRGTSARGFRGVGRLAGIGYCQELVFRSKAAGEATCSEMRWDCRKVKAALRESRPGNLADLVNQAVSVRSLDSKKGPDHFFEVELRGIVRHKNDDLLSPAVVDAYLSQVAPVSFCPEFKYADDILGIVGKPARMSELCITVSGRPVFRPHRNTFEVGTGVTDVFSELESIIVPTTDGAGVAAVGWILHHGYKGAIPPRERIKGIRLRTGNIQVGNDSLVDEIFPESRFNSWTVGEVHVIDPRIVPNGRRDHYEQNVHFHNLVDHLAPFGKAVAQRCRTSSQRRNWLREFGRSEEKFKHQLSVIKQGAVSPEEQQRLSDAAEQCLTSMEKITGRPLLDGERATLKHVVSQLRASLDRVSQTVYRSPKLADVFGPKRKAYEHVFDLIYRFSPNHVAAKSLVDQILRNIEQ